MKNYVLGLIGIGIVLYSILCFISIYSISTRKNELQNCASDIVRNTLEQYYGDVSISREQVEENMKKELQIRMSSASEMDIQIKAMDLKKGLLFVEITETFYLPNGFRKTINAQRNAIVEEE